MEEAYGPDASTGATETAYCAHVWARRLQRGEADAVREVRRRVERILMYGALTIPEQERDDLKQEVVTEIWRAVNRSRFDPTGGFWGFVEVVTARRCIDWLRSRREKVDLPHELETLTASPLDSALINERTELASDILMELEPECRELITLRLRDNVSYREIANVTGKSEGALRVQFYRCIGRARRILKQFTSKRQAEDAPTEALQ